MQKSKNKGKQLPSHYEDLLKGLDISDEDVHANREGYVTEHQVKVILHREGHYWLQWLPVILLLGLIPLLDTQMDNPMIVADWILFIPLLAGVLFLLYMRLQQAQRIRNGTVTIFEGRFPAIQRDKQGKVHMVNAKREVLDIIVPERLTYVLSMGKQYRVFYLDTYPVILSIEPLNKDDYDDPRKQKYEVDAMIEAVNSKQKRNHDTSS
ncbi:MAG: hypothetical protein AAFR81_08635 [Chloroflexota bacterium]